MLGRGALHFHFAVATDHVAGPSGARYRTEPFHLGELRLSEGEAENWIRELPAGNLQILQAALRQPGMRAGPG